MPEPPDISALITTFRKGTEHLTAIAKKMEFPWDPDLEDPRKLHNMYARNLISCYASKFSDLSNSLLHAVEQSNFLVYALRGRALIETVAMLHYYIQKYKPLMDKGFLSQRDWHNLIDLDDKHLRGARFDWEAFLFQRYSELRAEAQKNLKGKEKKKPALPEQISAKTCVEKWARNGGEPAILIAYDLFCDLVRPNVGSNFLIATTDNQRLYFSRFRGELVGKQIFEQSFSILVAAVKPSGEYLAYLMGTIWQDDQL